MIRFATIMFVLSGCRGGFLDREKTCAYDVYDWWDGLSTHVNQDRDAIFDYNPETAPVERISGNYDPSPGSGNFSWQVDYADGYFLQAAAVSGYGTVYFGGDLDTLYELTVRDSLDEDTRTRVREKRSGCMGIRRTTDLDSEEVTETEYQLMSDDSVVSRSTRDLGEAGSYTLITTERSDFSIETALNTYQGTWDYESTAVEDLTGVQESTWSQEDGTNAFAGQTTRLFSGKTIADYEWVQSGDKVADIHEEISYDGSGTAVYDYGGGDTCTATYQQDGDCTYTCSDGSSGNC